MKLHLLILALAVLLQTGLAAEGIIRPSQINWSQSVPENANITLDGGYIIGEAISENLVTVGPSDVYDYATDGTADELTLMEAADALGGTKYGKAS